MKKLNRLWVPAVALSLFAVGCSDEQVVNPTESSVPTPLFGKGAVVQSVTGSGQFTVGGELRTFSFNALRHANGAVGGRFAGFNRFSGGRISGRITCFTIEGGNAVWIAGVIEQANFDVIGSEGGWRAVDNGPPRSATPDQLSFARAVNATAYCANTPDFPEIRDIEAGNIRVQP